jgi:hypothetical protein
MAARKQEYMTCDVMGVLQRKIATFISIASTLEYKL